MATNILIADSGSTKAQWALLTGTGNQLLTTQGISPYFLNSADIQALLSKELLPSLPDHASITAVYYYGTGCTAAATKGIVRNALAALFPKAAIHVDYDLVAAAHALCGRSSGIACILGTGSNSCYYDGAAITRNNPGLGYVLGDEGSGAHLGKKIVTRYLYGHLDADLEKIFEQRFGVDKDSLLEKIYSASLPNRYLASFAHFFSEHRGMPVLENLLYDGLDDFFRMHIVIYTESRTVPVHFTGSIAWVYRDVLQRLCTAYSFQLGHIMKEPMQGLIDYYAAL